MFAEKRFAAIFSQTNSQNSENLPHKKVSLHSLVHHNIICKKVYIIEYNVQESIQDNWSPFF
jgi:hypothetical protein